MLEQQPISQETQLADYEQNLRILAGQGDAEACYQLVMYFENQFFSTELEEAQHRINLLVEASNQKHAEASILLGRWYLTGHYVDASLEHAISFLEFAATECQASQAYNDLANIYLQGVVTAVNQEKALGYLKKAVALNNVEAIYAYAILLLATAPEQALTLLQNNYTDHQHQQSAQFLVESQVFPVEQVATWLSDLASHDSFAASLLALLYLQQNDLKKACRYANIAQEKYDPYGCYIRAIIELQDSEGSAEIAHQFMLKAAKLGHIEACAQAALTLLGQLDQVQSEEIKQELAQQAIQFLHLAATHQHVDAQFSLGQCLRLGLGIEKDDQAALLWLERAALSGHSQAQFEVAMLIPTDHPQHVPLLKAAADSQYPQAILCMGLYEQQVARPDEAVTWFKRGQEIEIPRASYLLAKMYQAGQGKGASAEQAFELLKQAADLGEVDAYFELYLAYKDGNGVRKNKKSANKYLNLAKENNHLEAAALAD